MKTTASLIRAARSRLQRRNIVRGAVVGAWVGVGLAGVVLVVSRAWWFSHTIPEWSVAIGALGVCVIVGVVAGFVKPVLEERELALLLDRALGTDEVLVTLLHLEENEDCPAEIRRNLESRVASLPAVSAGVKAGPPKYSWAIPIAVCLAALLLLIPQRPDAVARVAPEDGSDVQEEAERLAEAVEEIKAQSEQPLPEEIEEKVEELLDDMIDDSLTAEEAAERAKQLQEELAAWEESLEQQSNEDEAAAEGAADALREQDMEQAAEEAAERLADAIEDGDTERVADALERLQNEMESMDGQSKEQLGEAMQRAGEALESSGSESMQELGESLKDAGQKLEQAGQGQQLGGEGGEQAGKEAAESMKELQEKLRNGGDLAERLKQDAEKLKKSQELNGALEASKQRLGGEEGVEQGQGQGEGEGQGQGQGQGQGEGQGQGQAGTGLDSGMGVSEGPPGSGAGGAHTWEDEGSYEGGPGHQDANRLSERTGGEVIDDFEAFYDPIRMDGAEGLVTKVDGQIDASGQMEALPTRRTDGDESASVPLLDVPDRYVDAADEALANERVPPGYRSAVKDYFDSME